MNYYFDTSALVKLFSNEAGSEKVKAMVTDQSNHIWVLELAQIEIICAIHRKYRNNEFPKDNLEPLLQAIYNQFNLFSVIPLDAAIAAEAQLLIKRFGKEIALKTLDALHIAGWFVLANPDCCFVSSDHNQLKVVEILNHQTIQI